MYWPKEGCQVYGLISVRVVDEKVLASHTVRHFVIKHSKIKCKKANICERHVYQYHYTNWPDHGTPDHPLPILNFIRKSASANPDDAGPIVVHCSAGVGRTGAYIMIDTMLRQIKVQGRLSIFPFLKHIRSQRNFLVQTEEQYIFIHDVILEAILSGHTSVPAKEFPNYIRQLQYPDVTHDVVRNSVVLDSQYHLVCANKSVATDFESALKPFNTHKNRVLDFIPIDKNRVHLTPKPGVEGSDYINASWLPGFRKIKEFIVTQHPLESTVDDFWQMVWDHNAQTIVLISDIDETEFSSFWAQKCADIESESFKVVYNDETHSGSCVTRDFTVQSLHEDYELSVRIILQANWPTSALCGNTRSVFDLVQIVQKSYLQYQNGPVVVIDRFGGTEAATFCSLLSMYEEFREENHIDVYTYAKLYNLSRPGVWRSQADYLLLYRLMECFVSGNSDCKSNGAVFKPNGNHICDLPHGNETRVPPDGTEYMMPCDESSV